MAEREGQHLGNYRLLKLLGQGGFAEVYLGEHTYLGTKAAIKLLYMRVVWDEVAVFQQEARTLANLVHPNIVRVLEFGVEASTNTPYLVMDYAPGGTLRQRHPRGTRLPLSTVVTYVKQVAAALQYAHDEKFIHRDVKPENMLLGRNGEVLLSDFGIVVLSQTGRTSEHSIYNTAGTLYYMAPEQIRGKPERASDQYALAVMVYEWLCGKLPFSEGNALNIQYQHIHEPAPPLHQQLPTISPTVEQVVLTALAKDPKERFGNVQAFANALEQASQLVQPPVMGTPPSQAAPQALLSSPGVPYASRGISRRTVILGLGLAGLTVAGGGIALLALTRGPQVSSHLPTLPPTARPTSGPIITSILHGAVATATLFSNINLTSEGTSDWIHWGLYANRFVDRKNGGSPQISTFSTIGNAIARAYNNNGIGYSWSDGMPESVIVDTTTGVYVNGVNNGFSFAVPASTTTRTLRVHLDVYLSQAKFTASLNDGSGLVYTDESLNNAGATTQGVTQAVYTLTYRSSSAGSKLTITFVEVNAYNGVANVALQAATLQ